MKTFPVYLRSLIAMALLAPLCVTAGPVDINAADAKTLARELDGIGLARAQAIVDYRDKNGPFKNAADLTKVKGIPMKVVDANRENIKLGGSGAPDKAKSKSEKPDTAS